MCGIIAINGDISKISKVDQNLMLSSLDRRGPDEKNSVRFEKAFLGHTRLSIIDLSTGGQPMEDSTKRYTVVFNGEIYNYKNIRDHLQKLGRKFLTASDTEVILNAYAEYGRKCLDHLDGMYAFAIWDKKEESMFLARDRFGKKPLYFAKNEKTVIFASEIKTILESRLLKGKIDPQALNHYLRLMYVPAETTIYSNIHSLPPAHACMIKNGEMETWKYWNLRKNELNISYEQAKEKTLELIKKSVEKRMIADVEIGSLLSGGVDSTLVTYLASKMTGKKIKTFSVGYEGPQNELAYASQASRFIGTDHSTLNAGKENMKDLLEVISYFDEPHSDPSDFPQHLVSMLASSKVKVALSGDGADELFMGYGWYQKYWNTPRYRMERILGNPYSSYLKLVEVFDRKERKRLLYEKKLDPKTKIENDIETTNSSPFKKINDHNLFVYLPGQLLTKIDRTSMMNSLEIRSPFLDTELAEFAYSLPDKFKFNERENKILIKDILSDIMGKEFSNRRKQGFGPPLQSWLTESAFQKKIKDIAENSAHPMYKYLNRREVRETVGRSARSDKTSIQKIWTLLCLGLWFETHSKYHE